MISADGSAGSPFINFEEEITIVTEVSNDHHEYDSAVTSQDHHITIVTTLEYIVAKGTAQTVSFTSMEGTHQQFTD